ncbi:MAG: hypothetical protein ACTHZ1_00130 [Sphingobacterium sp.]
MENPIGIILLIIAGVIYKVYQGYKEEQEKAKKRMEKLKRKVPAGTTVVRENASRTPRTSPIPSVKPDPVLSRPSRDYPEFELPTPVQSERHTSPPKYKRPEKRRDSTPTTKKALEIVETSDQLYDSNRPEFDLRQAIIQEAILNRPYIN